MKQKLTVLTVVGIALWFPLLLAVTSLQGCQSGTTGILRPISPAVEHGVTNTLPQVAATVSAVLPAPFSAAVQATAAAVLALLAAWQGLTHEKLRKLTADSEQSTVTPKL